MNPAVRDVFIKPTPASADQRRAAVVSGGRDVAANAKTGVALGIVRKLLYYDLMDIAKLTPRHITWTLRAFRAPFSAGLATATEARRAMTARKRIVIME
ncbi:related to sialidase [Aspergillus luchuensis]|uniref:Related to sialidase n=1 Tax=Aspergillus kawachii TaxID=1069201 RepID=A0A146FZ10_ASPKA|nr:related to sialidase [Aspergillus luchuensis]